MNCQTVRLVSTFESDSCVSSLGQAHKWKLRTRFQFWAVPLLGLHNLVFDSRVFQRKMRESLYRSDGCYGEPNMHCPPCAVRGCCCCYAASFPPYHHGQRCAVGHQCKMAERVEVKCVLLLQQNVCIFKVVMKVYDE